MLHNYMYQHIIFRIVLSCVAPLHLVEISTADRPRINNSLTLRCDAFTVIEDTSSVDIIWSISKNDRQIKRTNNITVSEIIDTLTIYSDSLMIPSLSLYDTENNYHCQVLINSTAVKENFTIILPSMQVHNYAYIRSYIACNNYLG